MKKEIPVQLYLANMVDDSYGKGASALALRIVHDILGHAGGVELATGTLPWLLERAGIVPERTYTEEYCKKGHGLPIPYDLLATAEQRTRIQEALSSLSSRMS